MAEVLPSMFYAHTLSEHPSKDWEPLEQHLDEVAKLAERFADVFDGGPIARLAGLWHDIGKYAPQFQRYLERSHADPRHVEQIDHSSAGAVHAHTRFRNGLGLALAFVIAGHHAGLADYAGAEDSSLSRRLQRVPPETSEALQATPPARLESPAPRPPSWFPRNVTGRPLAVSMLIRMVFSCLIDADRLATERFRSRDKATARGATSAPTIGALRQELDDHLVRLRTDRAADPAPVDRVRDELLAACRDAAARAPGVFTLTAPTGSGKTFASMAFALAHAERHGLRRVVYALPFTSVTEQNAHEFRRAFGAMGEAAVLEHHSAYDPRDADENHPTEVRRRLLAENWDAPVVVTTNVRLLECLFAASPTDARRLHRLARSVIVLDEAQSLPVHLLKPTLAALQELVDAYGVSIVLCSATMPAVKWREDFSIGLRGAREIVPDPIAMGRAMRRTRVTRVGMRDDDALVDRLADLQQVLAIVNTRKHASRLSTMLKDRGVAALHLSALMCPEHRSRRVSDIRRMLAGKEPCRVVSTQVIEAGVDVDFPVVLRAMAGLDSIVQAAGRCNREGRGRLATVEVFDTDERPPALIGRARDDARIVLTDARDPLALDTIHDYFAYHYWSRSRDWDGGIDECGMSVRLTDQLRDPEDPKARSGGLRFRTASETYRVIEDWSAPIVVPYGVEGRELCGQLVRSHMIEAKVRRLTQRWSVSVAPYHRDALLASGACTLTESGHVVLTAESHYNADLGLLLDWRRDPEELVR